MLPVPVFGLFRDAGGGIDLYHLEHFRESKIYSACSPIRRKPAAQSLSSSFAASVDFRIDSSASCGVPVPCRRSREGDFISELEPQRTTSPTAATGG